MKLSVLTAVLLAHTACAQSQCGTVFDQCLLDIDRFKESSCTPLKNATLAAQCECYFLANKYICYDQCLTPSAQITSDQVAVKSTRDAKCAAVSLNPNNLPQTAPWQTFFPSTVPTVPRASSTAGTTKPTNGGSNTSDAKTIMINFGVLCAAVLFVMV